MIQGATIRRAKPNRISAESTTSAVSHAHIGIERTNANDAGRKRAAAALSGKPDLAEPARELGGFRILGADAHVGRRVRNLPQHGIADGAAADRFF